MRLDHHQRRAAIEALERAADLLRRVRVDGQDISPGARAAALQLLVRAAGLDAMADALRSGEALVP